MKFTPNLFVIVYYLIFMKRKMLTMDDLGEGTIKAVKEEEERRKLLLDQRKATVRFMQVCENTEINKFILC